MSKKRLKKVMIIANHYNADHAMKIKSYKTLDTRASTWNGIILDKINSDEFSFLIICFYPILKPYIFKDTDKIYLYIPRLPYFQNKSSLYTRSIIKLIALIYKPDLIHGIGSEHGYTYAAVNIGYRSVITIHGYLKEISKIDSSSYQINNRRIKEEYNSIKEANRIIAINEYMKELLSEQTAKDNITVIPNPINSVYSDECTNIIRNNDFIMVGTITELKNYDKAIETLKILKEEYNISPVLKIVGAPTNSTVSYYEELKILIAKYDIENVEFMGNLTPIQLKQLYCNTRFLLHLSSYETDSLVVSEAMECGCIPIVNRAGNLIYKVKNEETGYHVDSKDIVATANTLNRLITTDYDYLKEVFRLNYEKYPDISKIVQQTIDAYTTTIY